MARPTIYTLELGKEICKRLSEGESLRQICRQNEDMPSEATVYFWLLDEEKKEFLENYEKARTSQASMMFEELEYWASLSVEDIVGDDKSDNARVSARKLQIDTRKWILSKMLPKKYGEKMDVTSGDKPIPSLLHVLNHKRNKKNSQS